MIHQPLIGGHGISGQATDVKIRSDNLLKTRDKLNRILSENTGQELSKIEHDTDRDNFMSAAEAAEYGLVDRVIAHR
jgi:ATP-dependent Clp protease protease subunit